MISVIDIETDSPNPEKANLKFFGGLNVETGKLDIFNNKKNVQISDYINSSSVLVGFNLKGFDNKVLERYGIDFKYKSILDLYEVLAPKGDNGFGANNKNRLSDINPSLKLENYKLKTIIEVLDLDEENKGDIDYNIFKKDEWSEEEEKEIKKYLSQDLNITYKLLNWYRSIFKPIEKYLPKKDVEKLKHLNCTNGSLAYKMICFQSGLEEQYEDYEKAKEIKKQSERLEGGHHIHPRYEKVRGNIVVYDFCAHYPTIFIMAKLHNEKVTNTIHNFLKERHAAKSSGDKVKNIAFKVPLNSIYGITGNPTFKNIYNPKAASECTRIGRELLKKYAKTLDISGFTVLYGFTDSVFSAIPKPLTDEDLEITTDCFVEETKKQFPNPIDSYGLSIDKKLKFVWFIEKKDNNYLWVTRNNKVGIKGGLFDKNCPECIKKVFDNYIKPKIIKDLDVDFTKEDLYNRLITVLKNDPESSSQSYSVKNKEDYNVDTSLQYQISERYGPGKHKLIPNTAGIGVGRSKDLRYCNFKEFQERKITFEDIATKRMMRYLEPFYSTQEEVFEI